MKWFDWPIAKKERAWLIHCVDMLEQAVLIQANSREYRLLWLAILERLLSQRFGFLPKKELDTIEKRSLYQDFITHLQSSKHLQMPKLLDQDWPDLKRWTEELLWPNPDS